MPTDVASQRHKTQRMNLDGGKLMLFLIRDRDFSYCGRTLAAVIDICFSIEEWPKEKKLSFQRVRGCVAPDCAQSTD